MARIAKARKKSTLGKMTRIDRTNRRWPNHLPLPNGITHAYTDDNVIALVSEDATEQYGTVTHLWIRDAASSINWPWYLLQEIKNRICGENRVAIEIFPASEDLVDSANMRHLWVFPDGFRFPFGL